jgi:hypothetical protein
MEKRETRGRKEDEEEEGGLNENLNRDRGRQKQTWQGTASEFAFGDVFMSTREANLHRRVRVRAISALISDKDATFREN